jgi:hypothetical protein
VLGASVAAERVGVSQVPAKAAAAARPSHTFALGPTDFLLDGQPFQILSCELHPARIPAAFQTRSFPFRLDGIRGQALMFTNMSIQRNFRAGEGRTWQLRVDVQNLFNRQQWQGPNLNPTSAQFGQVTNVALNQMRFITFVARMTF